MIKYIFTGLIVFSFLTFIIWYENSREKQTSEPIICYFAAAESWIAQTKVDRGTYPTEKDWSEETLNTFKLKCDGRHSFVGKVLKIGDNHIIRYYQEENGDYILVLEGSNGYRRLENRYNQAGLTIN